MLPGRAVGAGCQTALLLPSPHHTRPRPAAGVYPVPVRSTNPLVGGLFRRSVFSEQPFMRRGAPSDA